MTRIPLTPPAGRRASNPRLVSTIAALIGAVVIGLAAAPVSAQDQGAEKGRYTMSPVDNGFVRLDTQTGAMSHCTRADGRWSCEAMADGGTDTRQEVERLRKENADLRAEIKRLDDMLGLGDNAKPGGSGSRESFRLPTEKDVDQALDYFEKMLKKFQDRLKRLEDKPGERGTEVPAEPPVKPQAAPPERKTTL